MALDLEIHGKLRSGATVLSGALLAVLILAAGGEALGQGAPKAGELARPTNSTVTPEGQLLLVPGRQLRLTVSGTTPTFVSEGPAPPDAATVGKPNATIAEWANPAEADLPKQAGVVTFTLYVDPARGSKLVVANNSGSAVIYQATLLVSRNGAPASVQVTTCSVPVGNAGVEYWAGLQVETILAPRVAATPAPTCFDPTADKFYAPGTPPPSQAAGAAPGR